MRVFRLKKLHFSLSNSIWGAPHHSTIQIALNVIVSGYIVALKGYVIRSQGFIQNLFTFKNSIGMNLCGLRRFMRGEMY